MAIKETVNVCKYNVFDIPETLKNHQNQISVGVNVAIGERVNVCKYKALTFQRIQNYHENQMGVGGGQWEERKSLYI